METSSESLQRARESLRGSGYRSIDGTEEIGPVLLTSADWAKHLATNFRPEDLLDDVGLVRDRLFATNKNRAALLDRRNTILSGQQDISELKTAEDIARADLAKAQIDMTAGRDDLVIKLIQLYFETKTKKMFDAISGVDELKLAGKGELNHALQAAGISRSLMTDEQFNTLCDSQKACLTKRATLEQASEAYTRAQLALAQAKSDNTTLLAQLQHQIDALTLDVDYYKKVLENAVNPLGTLIVVNGNEVRPFDDSNRPTPDKVPELPPDSDGASIWQEVVLSYDADENASSRLSTAQMSLQNWQTGLWFWPANDSSDSWSGYSVKNTSVKIAMRMMKVAIERPWLSPGVLGRTKDFYHAGGSKISKMNPSEVKATLSTQGESPSKGTVFASMPTAFIVAKDVHIILSSSTAFDYFFISSVRSSLNSGGGFLCFSTSKTEGSSNQRESAVVKSDSHTLDIKILSPQIIGWISELTPKDECSETYTSFPDDEFADKALQPQLNGLRVAASTANKTEDSVLTNDDAPNTPPTPP